MCYFEQFSEWDPLKFAFVAAFQILLCLVGYTATYWQISFFGDGCPDGNDRNYYISFSYGLCYSGEYGLSGFNGKSSFTSCSTWESISNNDGNDDVIINNDHNAPAMYIQCRKILIAAMVFAIFFTLSFLIKDQESESMPISDDNENWEPKQHTSKTGDVETAGEPMHVEPAGFVSDSVGPVDTTTSRDSTVNTTSNVSSTVANITVNRLSNKRTVSVEPGLRRPKTDYELSYEADNYYIFPSYWHRWQYIRCFQVFLGCLVAFFVFVAFTVSLSTVFYRLPRNYGEYYTDCQHATSLPSFGWAAVFCSMFITFVELYMLCNGNELCTPRKQSNTCAVCCFTSCFGKGGKRISESLNTNLIAGGESSSTRESNNNGSGNSYGDSKTEAGTELPGVHPSSECGSSVGIIISSSRQDVSRVSSDALKKPYAVASLYGTGGKSIQKTIRTPVAKMSDVANPIDVSVTVSSTGSAHSAQTAANVITDTAGFDAAALSVAGSSASATAAVVSTHQSNEEKDIECEGDKQRGDLKASDHNDVIHDKPDHVSRKPIRAVQEEKIDEPSVPVHASPFDHSPYVDHSDNITNVFSPIYINPFE